MRETFHKYWVTRIYEYMCVCVCVCLCVERERERERMKQSQIITRLYTPSVVTLTQFHFIHTNRLQHSKIYVYM
jgi:hypothetical protein